MANGNSDHRPFSRRQGFASPSPEISIREDAPDQFRFRLLTITNREAGISPSSLRPIVCDVLCVRPDPSNWSEYPNINDEVQDLVYGCEWFKVYDIVEAIWACLNDHYPCRKDQYTRAINDSFVDMGIGWQLVDGRVQARGEEAQDRILHRAAQKLDEARMPTARSELREAVNDLSKRPEADLSGAIHHAMSALECVARELSGDANSTLGAIIRRHPDLLPRPLDEAMTRVWGYASETARHGR